MLYFQLGFSTCAVHAAGFNNVLYPRPGFSTLFYTFTLVLIPCDVLSTWIVCFSAYVQYLMLYFQLGFSTLCSTFSLGFPPYAVLSAWVLHLVLHFCWSGFYNVLQFRFGFYTPWCTLDLGFIPCAVLSAWVFHFVHHFRPRFYTLCCTLTLSYIVSAPGTRYYTLPVPWAPC